MVPTPIDWHTEFQLGKGQAFQLKIAGKNPGRRWERVQRTSVRCSISVFNWRSWHMSANGLETFDRSIHATELAALDVEVVTQNPKAGVEDIWKMAQSHIIDQAELVGTYAR